MDQTSELQQAMDKLSQIANEEAIEDDIPDHFRSKIQVKTLKKKHSSNTYDRNENFKKDRSFKIEEQKRLKFLEELSEIRDKPFINSSAKLKNNTPIYMRAAQIMKDRNLNLSNRKLEISKQALVEEGLLKKNTSLSPEKGNKGFFDQIKNWQMKKERNIKVRQEEKEKNEMKDVKFYPTLNENSKKILKKLKDIQNSPNLSSSLSSIFSKKHICPVPQPSFHPSVTAKSQSLLKNRQKSVFDRLYPSAPLQVSPDRKQPSLSPKRKAPCKSKSSNYFPIELSYSINSGRGVISNQSLIEEINYNNSMSFLLQGLF